MRHEESWVLQQLLDGLPLRKREGVPPTRVFYLHPGDDASSVIDRFDWADDTERVVLVTPIDAAVLSKRLDLVRVQRQASHKHVDIGIVTLVEGQRAIARELGIPVFSSVERAETGRWRSRRPVRSAVPSPKRRSERPHPAELRPRDSRIAGYVLGGMTLGVVLVLIYDLITVSQIDLRQLGRDAAFGLTLGVAVGLVAFLLSWLFRRYLPRQYGWLRWAFMTLVFAAGILAPIGAAYIILPEARLTLTPAQVPVSAIARITVVVAGPEQEKGLDEIDFEGQRISGRRVSAEVAAEAVSAATGTSDVPSSRATGTAVFSNLLAQDYTVGRNTAVRTSAGSPVRFLTTGDVTVPPLGQAAVGVEAVEPGPQGNVGVGLINRVEGASVRAVRVTNPEPTRGGGVSQVRAVTKEDRDALRKTLLAELQAQGHQRVLERPESEGGLREGEYLVPGSVRVLQVLQETFDRFATEEAESVKLEMLVAVTGVVVDLGDAYNLARHVLSQRVPEGYVLRDSQYLPGLMGDNVIGDGTLTFFVEAEGSAEAELVADLSRKAWHHSPLPGRARSCRLRICRPWRSGQTGPPIGSRGSSGASRSMRRRTSSNGTGFGIGLGRTPHRRSRERSNGNIGPSIDHDHPRVAASRFRCGGTPHR
jgi:hypothetical protein